MAPGRGQHHPPATITLDDGTTAARGEPVPGDVAQAILKVTGPLPGWPDPE